MIMMRFLGICKAQTPASHYNGISVCVFYYSPRQDVSSQKSFWEKLQLNSDYVQGKYPTGGMFLHGDANELRLESLEAGLGLNKNK